MFKCGACAALIALVASAPYCYRKFFLRVEEEVRSRIVARVSERLPNMVINVRSAHLAADGIVVRGLSIAEPGAPGPEPELVYLDEVLLSCHTSLQELVSGEPVITAVKVSRPVIRATRRPDGSFSLSRLFPPPKCDRPPPPITVESGTIVVFDPLKNPSSTLTLRDVNVTARLSAAASEEQVLIDVEGYLTADQIQRVYVSGTVDPVHQRWAVTGTVDGLDVSPELRQALPERLSEPMEVLHALRASITANFRASGDGPGQMPRFEVDGRVTHGHLEDPLLPYPVTDVQAQIHCDNAGIRIEGLTARHGPTIWQIAEFTRQGYESQSPFKVSASARQMRLDGKWAGTLPKPWSTYWQDYDPEGEVDLDCTLEYDGQRYKPTLEVTCLDNVSFSFYKFPYRMEGARGKISLRDGVMDVKLTAYSDAQFREDAAGDARASGGASHRGGSPVTFVGRFYNPGPKFTGAVEIQAERIQFDEKLFAALLKPKARETLRSLKPHGNFKVYARLWRDDPSRREMHQFAEISLARCSIDYEKFPLPLANLQGVLHMTDGQWKTVPELVGTNGTGIVALSGTLSTSADADTLMLKINAKNFPLHEELRDALSPSQRQLWYALQPHGKIDLNADVHYESSSRKTTVTLRAIPRDDATSIGTSIEPVEFPYRMRLRGGSIYYSDGHAELENLDVVHGGTRMHAVGSCDLSPEGAWQLRLRKIQVDRLRLQGEDHDLEAALPDALKHAIAELKPTGPINLQGALELAKLSPKTPLHVGWDVHLYLHQNSLQAGTRLENVFGRVRLTGTADGARYASRGELDLKSLTYKNFQLIGVNGPIWFDNQNVVLGSWQAAPTAGAQPRHVTATLLGGTLSGDCHVRLGALPHYHLVGALAQADLNQFAVENLTNHQKLKGKILARVDLQGNGAPRSLVGSGTVHLSDANVYELPVMVSLLKIVRAKTPDSTAFTESDVAFSVQGEHVTLNEIQLSGDAISLSGQGELTLDGVTNPINLKLHTTVGRVDLPILSSMLREASQQIMLINVAGSLDNPVARTEAFPAARGALQQLQGDSQSSTLLPRPGSIMRAIGLGR